MRQLTRHRVEVDDLPLLTASILSLTSAIYPCLCIINIFFFLPSLTFKKVLCLSYCVSKKSKLISSLWYCSHTPVHISSSFQERDISMIEDFPPPRNLSDAQTSITDLPMARQIVTHPVNALSSAHALFIVFYSVVNRGLIRNGEYIVERKKTMVGGYIRISCLAQKEPITSSLSLYTYSKVTSVTARTDQAITTSSDEQ